MRGFSDVRAAPTLKTVCLNIGARNTNPIEFEIQGRPGDERSREVNALRARGEAAMDERVGDFDGIGRVRALMARTEQRIVSLGLAAAEAAEALESEALVRELAEGSLTWRELYNRVRQERPGMFNALNLLTLASVEQKAPLTSGPRTSRPTVLEAPATCKDFRSVAEYYDGWEAWFFSVPDAFFSTPLVQDKCRKNRVSCIAAVGALLLFDTMCLVAARAFFPDPPAPTSREAPSFFQRVHRTATNLPFATHSGTSTSALHFLMDARAAVVLIQESARFEDFPVPRTDPRGRARRASSAFLDARAGVRVSDHYHIASAAADSQVSTLHAEEEHMDDFARRAVRMRSETLVMLHKRRFPDYDDARDNVTARVILHAAQHREDYRAAALMRLAEDESVSERALAAFERDYDEGWMGLSRVACCVVALPSADAGDVQHVACFASMHMKSSAARFDLFNAVRRGMEAAAREHPLMGARMRELEASGAQAGAACFVVGVDSNVKNTEDCVRWIEELSTIDDAFQSRVLDLDSDVDLEEDKRIVTVAKQRTMFQTQTAKAGKTDIVHRDFLISWGHFGDGDRGETDYYYKLRGRDALLEGGDGKGDDHKGHPIRLPTMEWPFDHCAVTADIALDRRRPGTLAAAWR